VQAALLEDNNDLKKKLKHLTNVSRDQSKALTKGDHKNPDMQALREELKYLRIKYDSLRDKNDKIEKEIHGMH
jgi:hypothetical protein